MYSGTILKQLKYFDAWFGAHQKIDRVARRNIKKLMRGKTYSFPSVRQIVRFEGLDGPDGIKRKTPAKDEPWHFYDPTDPNDNKIIKLIDNNLAELVTALRSKNQARAAFEAAWLAHALVDGLTPAHHYPYEEELIKLRGGQGMETRNTIKEKLIVPGETVSKWLRNNWKVWGDNGLIATHFAFEWGVAAMLMPLRLSSSMPTKAELKEVDEQGVAALFRNRANQIAELKMYEEFYKSGWNLRLAKQVRRELGPLIVNTVSLAWYAALVDAKRAAS